MRDQPIKAAGVPHRCQSLLIAQELQIVRTSAERGDHAQIIRTALENHRGLEAIGSGDGKCCERAAVTEAGNADAVILDDATLTKQVEAA